MSGRKGRKRNGGQGKEIKGTCLRGRKGKKRKKVSERKGTKDR